MATKKRDAARIAEALAVRIGENVQSARLAQKLTQREFARKAGIDQPSMSGIERGGRNLTLRMMVMLAEALDLEVADLLD